MCDVCAVCGMCVCNLRVCVMCVPCVVCVCGMYVCVRVGCVCVCVCVCVCSVCAPVCVVVPGSSPQPDTRSWGKVRWHVRPACHPAPPGTREATAVVWETPAFILELGRDPGLLNFSAEYIMRNARLDKAYTGVKIA